MTGSMAADVPCPHCGAANFSISAYCQRCERPLKVESALQPTQTPPPLPTSRPRMATHRPIELPPPPRRAPVATRSRAVTAPRRTSAPGDTRVLAPAAAWRVLLAAVIDVLVLVAVSGTVIVIELWFLGKLEFQTTFRLPLDIAAEWVFVYQGPLLHALAVSAVVGWILGVRPGGRTLGRRLVGTVVVRSSGRPYTVGVILLRAVGLLVTIGTVGLGFFWALFDPHRRAWHDLLAGTVTVRARDFAHGSKVENA